MDLQEEKLQELRDIFAEQAEKLEKGLSEFDLEINSFDEQLAVFR